MLSLNPFTIVPARHLHLPPIQELFADTEQWMQLHINTQTEENELFADIDNDILSHSAEFIFQPPSPCINASPWQQSLHSPPPVAHKQPGTTPLQPIQHDLQQFTQKHSAVHYNTVQDEYDDTEVAPYWQSLNGDHISDLHHTPAARDVAIALYDPVTDTYPYFEQQQQKLQLQLIAQHAAADVESSIPAEPITITVSQYNHTSATDNDNTNMAASVSVLSLVDALPPVTPLRVVKAPLSAMNRHSVFLLSPMNDSVVWSAAKPVVASGAEMQDSLFVSPFVTTRSKSIFNTDAMTHHITPIQGQLAMCAPDVSHITTSDEQQSPHQPPAAIKSVLKHLDKLHLSQSPITATHTHDGDHAVTPLAKQVRFDVADSTSNDSTHCTPSTTHSSVLSMQHPRMTPSFTVNGSDVDALYQTSTYTGVQPFHIQLTDFSVGSLNTSHHTLNTSQHSDTELASVNNDECACTNCRRGACSEQHRAECHSANSTLHSIRMLPSHNTSIAQCVEDEPAYNQQGGAYCDDKHDPVRRGSYPALPVLDYGAITLRSRCLSCPPEMWHDDAAHRKLEFDAPPRSYSVEPMVSHVQPTTISRRASPITVPSIYEERRSFAHPMHVDYSNLAPQTPPARTSRQHSAVSQHSPALQPIQLLSPMSPSPQRHRTGKVSTQTFTGSHTEHATPVLVSRKEPLPTYVAQQSATEMLLVDRLRMLEDKIDQLMRKNVEPVQSNNTTASTVSNVCAACTHSHQHTPHSTSSLPTLPSNYTQSAPVHMYIDPTAPASGAVSVPQPTPSHAAIGAYAAPRQLYGSYLRSAHDALAVAHTHLHHSTSTRSLLSVPRSESSHLYSVSASNSPLPSAPIAQHVAPHHTSTTAPSTPSTAYNSLQLPQPLLPAPAGLLALGVSVASHISPHHLPPYAVTTEQLQVSALKQRLFELNEQKYVQQYQLVAQKLPAYCRTQPTSTYIGASCSTANLRKAALDLKLAFVLGTTP